MRPSDLERGDEVTIDTPHFAKVDPMPVIEVTEEDIGIGTVVCVVLQMCGDTVTLNGHTDSELFELDVVDGVDSGTAIEIHVEDIRKV